MDFESDNIDPYEILGVPFGASIEVCKATYKSLSKIYHPDVFVGEKSYAAKRMAELNAAFEFLDNPGRKKKWDGAGQKAKQKAQSQEYEPDNDSEEFSKASNALRENWDFACKFHPELVQLYKDLRQLNSQTAFLFMAVIVEEKLYSKAPQLAERLEDQFLISKFSKDPDLKKIAKYAVLNKEKKFAQDLNRALKVLGESSKYQIIKKLLLEYPDIGYHVLKAAGLDRLIPDNNPLKENERAKDRARHRTAQEKNYEKSWKENDLVWDPKSKKIKRQRNWKIKEGAISVWHCILFLLVFSFLGILIIFALS